jgi:hypothetical protein
VVAGVRNRFIYFVKENVMTLKTKMMIASAAMGGLMAGAASRAHAATPVTATAQTVSASSAKATSAVAHPGVRMLDDQPTAGKHDCKGKNDCKGQGGCKSSDNGCKGKNSCKGKGGCNGKDDSGKKSD